MSTGSVRGDRVLGTSHVTPTPKGRHVAVEAKGDATGEASGLGSQIITPDKPLQPDIDIYGSGSQTEDAPQTQGQSHSDTTWKAIPFRLQASTGQPRGSQDDDPFSDTVLHEAVDVTRDEKETEAMGSTNVGDEDAVSTSLIDAGQAEDCAIIGLVAPDVIDQEPLERPYERPYEEHHDQHHEQHHEHEKHGALTAASVPTTMEKEPENVEAAVLEAIDKDMLTTPIPQRHHQAPVHSFTTFESPPPSPKGKQVVHAPASSPSDSTPAISSLDAVNGLITIPIPPHYSRVRDLLWFMKSTAEAEFQPAPRTPSPNKRPRVASGTSAKRRKRTPKNPSKADVLTSPAITRSGKKQALEASDTQADSPTPPPTLIKKIILHFTRKSKGDTEGEAAPEPEPEPEEESDQETSETSDQPGTRDFGFYGSDADELDVDEDEDEDADAEEEVILP